MPGEETCDALRLRCGGCRGGEDMLDDGLETTSSNLRCGVFSTTLLTCKHHDEFVI